MAKFDIGTKFKGFIPGETFEIVGVARDRQGINYYTIKHLRTGVKYKTSVSFLEHLEIKVL